MRSNTSSGMSRMSAISIKLQSYMKYFIIFADG
jgi:hypothetical protein